jgi:CxxC motif-containing protein (DUF1111 family)
MKYLVWTISAILLTLVCSNACYHQPIRVAVDPGPRGVSIDAGYPIAGLTPDQLRFFNDSADRFNHAEGVANGLGPAFNGNSCGVCHSQPAIGGTSPSTKAFPNVGPNPQVALATADGATNKVPFFVLPDGPIREARFKSDGGVHDLFSIQGRKDAPGCLFAQPDFDLAAMQNNLSLRIPTPTFGGGLIEAISDETILANMSANGQQKASLGIKGRPNRSGNDGTITRFGWKAQNKSLIMFSHEAYNVEVGETNQMFPNKRGGAPASCIFNPLPEDQTNTLALGSDPIGVPSDDDAFATFMRFLDQPIPVKSTGNGAALFVSVGCSLCHTPTMTTGQSSFGPGLSGVKANLFSDLLIHHMGKGLADGISQGNAGPDEFRTAPLWGLGQRIFFLQDGRTADLHQAIELHKSKGSEANKVINNFNKLSTSEQQDILNFLRSL